MARSIKDAGLEELGSIKKRVNRQHTLERISRSTRDDLIDMIDELETYIVNMDEKQEREGGLVW